MDRVLLEKELRQADSVLPIPLAKAGIPKALVINLDSESESKIDIPQIYLNKYVGGPALAARLWACFADTSTDSPIVITGGNNGSLITVAFKSPVTENLTFNTFSGRFTLDFCAVILIGKLKSYGIADFSSGNPVFNYDERLKHTSATEISNFYPGCIATGDAALNKLVYSTAVCNNTITGRGGLGYVMSEKNLKAICLDILPTARDTFDFSTFVKNASVSGWAPVDNISKRTDPRLFHLSAAEKNRKMGDFYIPCQATLMLGSNVGCYDIVSVCKRYQFCLESGLDPVSVGNILGWIREAQEESIVSFEEKIDFNDDNQVLYLMDSIVERRRGYEIFADGLRSVAKYFGNAKFAKEINNLECGPYDYRGSIASAINDAVGNWFPVYFDLMPSISIKDKVSVAIYNEELVMGLQCMNINPDVVVPEMINKISVVRRILLNNGVIDPERAFNTDDLNITDVFTVGQNCRCLVRKINHSLKNNKAYIPDFFCVDPESNAKDSVIVDIRKLLASYRENIRTIYLADSRK